MDEEKKLASYEDFREAVSEYGEEREGHDLLTDPEALASSREKAEHEEAVTHGQRLKAAREQRGFTVEELASKTEIPVDVLSQLEAGEAFLPLGQLIKLSKALSLKMADVISAGEEPFTIVRADQRRSFARFGKTKQDRHGYEYESLAPNKKDRLMEPFIVTLNPASADEPSSHDGQEFIYVIEGEMEVLVGDTRDVLKPGDAIYYDSTSLHLVKAHGDKAAKILAVLIS
ncbi:MAG: helix-turn-helix transcriptional regulator [Desulfomonile tiedjei]|uniref:Helix-turn-helix transcriptional regulator n=1 Tax=Desulfomonile tiedjei TaxID=2358 RepID=A0A9D6V2F4_9BACT|nr:helix-turn-helix transcriptional regulator [Desulfomonile tiedjei]